jgi:CubicO group peptidase (beta-lactamase class C family)/uncharacterized protein (DUF302 family)
MGARPKKTLASGGSTMNTKQLHPTFKMRGSSDVSYLNHSVDEMIYSFMADNAIQGLTLAIVQAPYIPRVVGYGLSDQKRQLLASPNTMYPAGPISQAFAAVALMQLYEDKKLDINDALGKYLPEAPSAWKNIALLSLLRHASGLADYRLKKDFAYEKDYDLKKIIGLVKDDPLLFVSGHDYHDSATDFFLLSEVISRVSGKPYAAFVKERQIDFLGLRRTATKEHLKDFAVENVETTKMLHERFKLEKEFIDPTETASSYDEKGQEIAKVSASSLRGSGDIYASAQDISYWDIALAGGVLIHDKKNRDYVYAPWLTPEGKTIPSVAGWHFYHHRGLMAIRGSYPGFSSFLSRFTHSEELVCVTLLANKENVDLANLARSIAGAFGDYMSTNFDDNNLYLLESQFGVEATIERLKAGLAKRGVPLFAEIDHMKNAEKVGLTMKPNKVLVLGSPKAGTPLMQQDPSLGLELPLKVGAFEDETGSTFVGFRKMSLLADEHGQLKDPRFETIERFLESLVNEAADI